MKKWCGLFVFFVLVFVAFVGNVIAQAPGLDTENFENDNIVQGVETRQETVEQERWKYLSEQWKELLLKNKFVSVIDGFFRKINFVFVVLFGQSYDLSITLFFVFLLWIFFAFNFWKALRDFSPLSSNVALAAGIGLTIILAQFGMLRWIAEFFVGFIFAGGTLVRWIKFIAFALGLFFVTALLSIAERYKRAQRKLIREKEQEVNQDVLDGIAKKLLKEIKG
ncbi:MAG: hypothetical protein KC506_02370 [Nanoarchaeota archaeon]|nr:hypothetical protein [Nanoarchaeota archaeon]